MLTGELCPNCAASVHRDGDVLRGVAGDVTLTVDGTPAPNGSRTVGRRRDGTAFTRPACRGEAAWVRAVAADAAACRSRVAQLVPPDAVALTFLVPRPGRSAYSHWSRRDVDKLARATLDDLAAGGLLVDARHVTVLAGDKRRARPCCGQGVVAEITRPAAAEAASRRSYGTSGDERGAA